MHPKKLRVIANQTNLKKFLTLKRKSLPKRILKNKILNSKVETEILNN